MKMPYYPNLAGEIARHGISVQNIADTMGITSRAFRNKISGRTDFTWPETNVIQKNFFPDLSKDYLFANREENQSA